MARGIERLLLFRDDHDCYDSLRRVAVLWIEWIGHSGVPAARAVGIRPEGVYRVAERGRQQAKYWHQVLEGKV